MFMRAIAVVLTAAVLSFGGVTVGTVTADPVSDLVSTLMPLPTGDSTFDQPEADLATMSPGDVIKTQVLDPTAALKLFMPGAQVTLIKVRSTAPDGSPSWATGTLVIPPTPWIGPGPQPVLVNNMAIDSLGRHCTPGYKLSHNGSLDDLVIADLPPTTQAGLFLGNYAVLLPDHQGPNMAYGDGLTAGHVIPDVIRGMYHEFPDLGHFVMTGYSGGAIATGWAAKLMPEYAPDLLDRYNGSAFGGIPADFAALRPTMDGTVGIGFYGAALIGQIRGAHPQLAQLAQPWVQLLANGLGPIRFQEQCVEGVVATGITLLQVAPFANVPDPYATPMVQQFFADTAMKGTALAGPLYLFNGSVDLWIPNNAVAALAADQRARGVDVTYAPVLGEHITGAVTGYPGAAEWVAQHLV